MSDAEMEQAVKQLRSRVAINVKYEGEYVTDIEVDEAQEAVLTLYTDALRERDQWKALAQELATASRLLCEAAIVDHKRGRFICPPAFAPAVRSSYSALAKAKEAGLL